MNFRTDLALERHESVKSDNPEGVKLEIRERENIKITHITVLDERGEKALGKQKGRYITAEIPSLAKSADMLDEWSAVLCEEISRLLPESEGTVLVAGLGNKEITPDALGPECISLLLATRHIKSELGEASGLSSLKSVAGIVPGVLGNTGIETAESIKGIVKAINPCAVIVVDALAARKLARLGNTIQMSDTGIIPGSGVGNARKAINKDFLGVPVISMGIPTVVDAQTLVNDLTDNETEISRKENKEMIITPREIDLVVERASKIIAVSINKALQPHLSVEEILMLVGK